MRSRSSGFVGSLRDPDLARTAPLSEVPEAVVPDDAPALHGLVSDAGVQLRGESHAVNPSPGQGSDLERIASLACDLLTALQPWEMHGPEVRSAAARLTVALAALPLPEGDPVIGHYSVGDLIASRRRLARLTQQDLADWLGCSQQTVARWETTDDLPPTHYLIPLTFALDLTVDELLKPLKYKQSRGAMVLDE